MSAVDDARRAGLLVKHAPTLAYHKHEPYWASSPAVMTDCVVEGRYATYLQTKNGSLIAQAGPSLVRPQLDLAFLNGETYGDDVPEKPASDDYLNAHGGTYVEDAALMQARPGYGDVVYGRYVEGQDDRVWLQYWLFYYFNDKSLAGIGLHEGDWEMVQVAIDHGVPSVATYAQHDGAEKRDDWEQVRKAEGSDGASPLAYVALGSHASYFDPGEYRIRVFPTLDHARGNGRRVRPHVVEVPGGERWLEWPGRWGRMGLSDASSPRGPMQHATQWLHPDRVHARARGKRRRLGPIFFALPAEARVPAPSITVRRDGEHVLITYDLRAAREGPERPARLLLSVESADPRLAPSTHSFLVGEERATVRHPSLIGAGEYVVHATALTADDAASDTVTVEVPPPGAGAPPGPKTPAPDREGFALRLLVELPGDRSPTLRALRRAVDDALGRDADGQRWNVDHLFPAAPGGRRPARLRRHFQVTGRAIVSPAYPPQQQAFDLAHRLRDAIGADVQPDLPSSVFALPEASDAAPRAARARAHPSPAPTAKDWSLRAIRVPAAWELEPGRGTGIAVGHPDTGYTDHDELEREALDLTRAWDVLDDDPDAHDPLETRFWWPLDSPGHGTATGSVIAGRSPGEIQGAAPGVALVPLRTVKSVVQVFDGDVAVAIERARQSRCDIVSMSLGGVGFAGAVRDAIRTAVESGMIVMAAAGNEVGFVTAPASWPECLAIGGTNVRDEPWRGSSHGPEVDFCAPAEGVWAATARREHRRAEFSVEPHDGTSFAVANTAGVAALWLAHHGADTLRRRYGSPNVQRLFLMLARKTARRPDGWDQRDRGAGILDARALLEAELPDPGAFGRRPAGAGAEDRADHDALDRLATLWPDRTKAQVRSALGRALGLRGAALDDALERFGGELFYQYSQDAELRESLAGPPPGAAGVQRSRGAAVVESPRALRRSSSRALRELLEPTGARSRRR
jgi:hypothetical protein